ncbi:MAG: hypothetical protein GWN62_13850 [Aliifodinibius sp.]|nr:hypothetical protein [Fodinibius sp.]
MKDKLNTLFSKCEGPIHITYNAHKDCYEPIEKYLSEEKAQLEEIDEKLRKEIIQKDSLIEIQIYPDTPIGFYKIYHWDLEKAVDEALECLD